jgi:hypothetical protein
MKTTMLIRLSNNRILNLAEVSEVKFTFDDELFAAVTLLSGGSGRSSVTIGACGTEAEALRSALRARPEQFAEVESGRYFNLDGILSVDFATMPDVNACGRWRATCASDANVFTIKATAAVRLREALAARLGDTKGGRGDHDMPF